MAKHQNEVNLRGTVGRDPEVKTVGNNLLIAEVSLATSEYKKTNNKDASGKDIFEETTTWHNVKCWAKCAEYIRDHVKKGMVIQCHGKITTEEWNDKTSGEKRSKTVIMINEVNVIATYARPQGQQQQGFQQAPPQQQYQQPQQQYQQQQNFQPQGQFQAPPQQQYQQPVYNTPQGAGLPPMDDDLPY